MSRTSSSLNLIPCTATVSLLKAIKLKGEFLYAHSVSVGLMAERIGKALSLSRDSIYVLKTAGLLHDIGKIAVCNRILLKPTTLNAHEWEQVRLHPMVGSKTLKTIPALKEQAEIILYHHIGVNGNSYPANISYKHIPFESKIIKICDIFTALTSERPYKATYPRENALEICKKEVPFQSAQLAEIIYGALISSPLLTVCEAREISFDTDNDK